MLLEMKRERRERGVCHLQSGGRLLGGEEAGLSQGGLLLLVERRRLLYRLHVLHT